MDQPPSIKRSSDNNDDVAARATKAAKTTAGAELIVEQLAGQEGLTLVPAVRNQTGWKCVQP